MMQVSLMQQQSAAADGPMSSHSSTAPTTTHIHCCRHSVQYDLASTGVQTPPAGTEPGVSPEEAAGSETGSQGLSEGAQIGVGVGVGVGGALLVAGVAFAAYKIMVGPAASYRLLGSHPRTAAGAHCWLQPRPVHTALCGRRMNMSVDASSRSCWMMAALPPSPSPPPSLPLAPRSYPPAPPPPSVDTAIT
jgi:hypothetical protein